MTVKALLLLAAAIMSHRVLSPPTPPAKPESMSRFGEGDALNNMARWAPIIGQVVVWSLAACEILVLMADKISSTFAAGLIPIFSSSTAPDLRLSPLFIVGWLLFALGGGLRLLCYRRLGRLFTYHLTIAENHHLVTTGPYAIVRHPSYTAWIAFMSGILLMQVSPGSWFAECGPSESLVGRSAMTAWVVYNLCIFAWIPARMRREDEALKRQFGDKWLQWSMHTRYKLVPGIY
ncbi:uncharacterized protein TRAVEDRAFT_19787 [Trametes versicolor FP-101664 SS1]|uniref:uncharacterized protein n=1 Tax=Trametes versicolor (strain FP-101664) TaxID=717944 RepID=UPI0004621B99|nr:uncharacterized protein TRAVEDRAFT_19787 [Trametes versicolor FP-101664 SS1]EIW59333.1 hypothetical protein TRAVEDRAFT_19787 [Trametes versicolor FP-101664 SS1]